MNERYKEVRQGLELLPLLLVVSVVEAPRVGALPRGFDFDEADQQILFRHREVWTRLQVSQA
jgi:hypothetical protein